MTYPEIIHHGGGDGVTGSCHELCVSQYGVLVDCGLFQGKDAEVRGIVPDIDFPVSHIKALVVTHVHIDHVGRIPHLLAAGFKGPIYCSVPSAHLLVPVLTDALKIGFTSDMFLVKRFIERMKKQLVPLAYGKWQKIDVGKAGNLAVKLKPAGHILGSAYVEFKLKNRGESERRVVFSGDLGAPYAPLLPSPQAPYGADVVVLESTYGNRLHMGRKSRRNQLKTIIEKALADRGVLLIPAFSIGRTQELLYEIEELVHRHRGQDIGSGLPWEDLEIIVDSPLASRFTELYRKLRPYWDKEALRKVQYGRHPLAFDQVTTIENHDAHRYTVEYLRKKANPCVVIAASGMCSGGRIVNYMKELIGDGRTDILFVGYQASGTPGRVIQKYGPDHGHVSFDGVKYDIEAGIHTISGYSAHADQGNLVNFIKRMRKKPGQVRLVHGESEAKKSLAEKVASLEGVSQVLTG